MKRSILCFAMGILLCTGCASMFQSTAKVVDPVGPIYVDNVPAKQTTVTGIGVGVMATSSVTADDDSGGFVETTTVTPVSGSVAIQDTTGTGFSGEARATATGTSATVVDEETGETTTVTAGMPDLAVGVNAAVNVAAVIGPVIQTTTTTTGPTLCGMSLDSHAALLDALRKTQYPDPQLSLIQDAASSNFITVDQTVAILQTLGYDMGREDAAVAIYPKTCDPQNWFKVYNALDNQVSRDDLKERLGIQ